MSYPLTPVLATDLVNLLTPDFATKFQTEVDAFMGPMRKHLALGRSLSMGKECWEYAVADSILNADWSGAGNSIVDVKISSDTGLDVKSVLKNKSLSGEASMYQNYSGSDHLFKNSDSQGLWDIYVNGWYNKATTIKNYYLLTVLKDESYNCSICGFKLTGSLPAYDISYGKFTPKLKSWRVEQLADPKLLQTTVLKSKKRLEMRVRKAMFSPQYALPVYTF